MGYRQGRSSVSRISRWAKLEGKKSRKEGEVEKTKRKIIRGKERGKGGKEGPSHALANAAVALQINGQLEKSRREGRPRKGKTLWQNSASNL